MSAIETPEELVARVWPCKLHPEPGACMSPFASAKVKAIRARDEQILAALDEEIGHEDTNSIERGALRAFAARLRGDR